MMSFSCVFFLVALAQAEHPGTFTPSNNYEHHHDLDYGYKCPPDSADPDPAVVIKWDVDKKGSNIFQSFGKTSVASCRSKKMCGIENGRYVTGVSPNDPYPQPWPQLSVTKGSDMGHVQDTSKCCIKNGRMYFTDPDYEDTHTFHIVSVTDQNHLSNSYFPSTITIDDTSKVRFLTYFG